MNQPPIDPLYQEDLNGVRLTWNAIPQSKIEASRLSIPLGALYTPLKQRPEEEEVLCLINDSPIICNTPLCGGILNPHCNINYEHGLWYCVLCDNARNGLPLSYRENIPHVQRGNETVEYLLPQRSIVPNSVFIFMVDLCVSEEDFISLKEQILVSLNYIPMGTLIGLVTFGKIVNVYELDDTIKSYSFNGKKEYSAEEVRKILGFIGEDMRSVNATIQDTNASRFLKPLPEAEFTLTTILDSLGRDEWSFDSSNQRPLRATGCALNITSLLLSMAYPKSGAQVLLFSGGACTVGPGKIASDELRESFRSHYSIEQGHAKYLKKAKEFYGRVSKVCLNEGTTVNVFVGAYDQVGLYEMEGLIRQSGGMIVLSDSFLTSIFKQSLQKFLTMNDSEGDLILGLNATLEVKTSRHLKISGFIGNATSLERDTMYVSKETKNAIGFSGSSAWKLSTIYANSSYAVYFDIVEDLPINQSAFIQFITHYKNVDGTTHLRVTTIAVQSKVHDFIYFFDQECATVLLARIAVDKLNNGAPSEEVVRYVDKILIKFLKRFATFLKNDKDSFSLIQQHSLLPQFIYHLKRSAFLQNFNNSPDESVFYRHYLCVEDTNNSLVMIQPTLTAYDQNHMNEIDAMNDSQDYGVPVLLDSLSLHPERILLLDTFFHILIHHGSTITSWRESGYQDLPEFANFKKLLEIPRIDAVELLRDRFPLPRFIDCVEGDSQSRFLYSRLNPTSNNNNGTAGDVGLKILNEDVRLQDFLEVLKETVVKG